MPTNSSENSHELAEFRASIARHRKTVTILEIIALLLVALGCAVIFSADVNLLQPIFMLWAITLYPIFFFIGHRSRNVSPYLVTLQFRKESAENRAWASVRRLLRPVFVLQIALAIALLVSATKWIPVPGSVMVLIAGALGLTFLVMAGMGYFFSSGRTKGFFCVCGSNVYFLDRRGKVLEKFPFSTVKLFFLGEWTSGSRQRFLNYRLMDESLAEPMRVHISASGQEIFESLCPELFRKDSAPV